LKTTLKVAAERPAQDGVEISAMPELLKKTHQRFLFNAEFALKNLKEGIALFIVPKLVAMKQLLNTLETNGVNNNKESQTSKSCLAHGATSPLSFVKDFQV